MIGAVEPAEIPSLVLAASGVFALALIVRRSSAGRPILHVVDRPFRPAPPSMLLLIAAGLYLVYQAGLLLVQESGIAGDVPGIAIPLAASAVALVLARRVVLLPRGGTRWRLGIGLLYLWASLPLVYATFLLARQVGLPEQPGVLAIRQRAEGWQALALAAVLVAPVAEEICFRGLIYPALRARLPVREAILFSSAAFALVHPPAVWLPMAIFAAFLAWLVETTGSVVPCIAAHMAFNGWNVAQLLLFPA